MIQSLLQMRDTTPCPRCASGSAKCWAWTSPCRCRCCCAIEDPGFAADLITRAASPASWPRCSTTAHRAYARRPSRPTRAVGDGPGRRAAAMLRWGKAGFSPWTRKHWNDAKAPAWDAPTWPIRERGAEDGAGGRRHRQGRQPAGRQGLQPCGCVVHKKIRLHGGLPGHAPGQVRPDALGRAHPRRGLQAWEADRRGGLAGCRVDPPFQPAASSRIMSAARWRSSRSANWCCPR